MPDTPKIPLPKQRPSRVKSATLHVISLAQFATAYTRGWAADSSNARLRLKSRVDQLEQTVANLREEIRIKDTRMAAILPHRRPHYAPTERMATLQLRAARGWSLKQTADTFLVTPATITSWMKRVDEQGPDALLQLREPVNRFPDFVRYAIQQLKTACPTMGKVKIAQTLARAGLHLGATTVGRILKEPPPPKQAEKREPSTGQVIVAKKPNHTWHVDLTTVPTGSGFWCTWLPFALSQQWPFCWWVAVVVDHFSRRIVQVGVFKERPTRRMICSFLGRTMGKEGKPKYIICDRDSIFDCDGSGVGRSARESGHHATVQLASMAASLSWNEPFVRSRTNSHTGSRSHSRETASVRNCLSTSIGIMNIGRIRHLKTKHPTKSTSNAGPPIGNLVSNRKPIGRDLHTVRNRIRLSQVSQVIDST